MIPESQDKIIKKISTFYDNSSQAYEMLLKAWNDNNPVLICEDTNEIDREFMQAELTMYIRRKSTGTKHSVKTLKLHLSEFGASSRDQCMCVTNGTNVNFLDIQYHGCVN